MTEIDYKKLKFKSGLEIHQQLDSHKLFCNCPSILRSDEPNFEIKRKLHLIAGESGEIDKAAKYQHSLDKEFTYQGYDTTCLVELDEEPPHEINQEALEIALQISLLLNCKIIPLTQIMRKTVIDGSNTSGFQRTVMIARNGFIETSKGKVGITAILLEEDAARKVSKEKDTYKLDRLGFPLVEIVTDPDIQDPEHAKEVALQIGDILRSCKVRRGIGTIRQDVNISIRNENRVEIKGMQDMNIFIKAIEKEIQRQEKLSNSKKPTAMEVRNVLPDATTEYTRPLPGSARMYPETDLPLLHISKDLINKIKKNLPKLKHEIQEDLKKTGLSEEMIKLLLKQNKVEEFKNLLKVYDKPSFIAKMILLFTKEVASKLGKKLNKTEEILEESYGDVLRALNKKKIYEADVKDILMKLAQGKTLESATKLEKANVGDIEENILKIIKEKPGLNPNAYMGLIMKEFKGQVSGQEVMGIIQKILK